MSAMACEQVEFVKALWVEQRGDALTCKELALFMLALDGAWRPGVVCLVFAGLKVLQFGVHRVATHALDASAQAGFSRRRWFQWEWWFRALPIAPQSAWWRAEPARPWWWRP